MRAVFTACLLVVLLMATAGVAYIEGISNARVTNVYSTFTKTTTEYLTTTVPLATTVTTTESFTSTSTLSTETAPSLELLLGVSPSTLVSGNNVSINMGLFNSLSRNYTITVVPWASGVGECNGSFPFSVGIYQGRYDFSNISTGESLLLFNASIAYPCFVSFNSTLDFGPHSDWAVDSNFLGQDYHQVNYTLVFGGSYFETNSTNNAGNPVYVFRNFPPGVYTVELLDQWDQTQLAYFHVS